LAEWLYEAGIGENRAILVEGGDILGARIELDGGLRAGAVLPARIATILVPGRRAIAALDRGGEALIEPLSPALTEGQLVHVEIVREAIPEAGRAKLPRGQITDKEAADGPALIDALHAPTRPHIIGPDLFERAGWSELLEQAASGEIGFPGGALRMALTPAMTLFDVDGDLPPPALAIAGARAAGRAIRRMDIGGSIGIDLPTLAGKADRQAAAAALDAVLPQPFERTAVNGFGFLQIVRRRVRPSLPELVGADPAGSAARALLRMAERAPGIGERTLTAAPVVVDRMANEGWDRALSKRIGAPVALRADPALAISAGHVHARLA